MKFITERDGFAGPMIDACDFECAVIQAEEMGARVLGEWVLTIENPDMTSEKADAIAKALAESIDF